MIFRADLKKKTLVILAQLLNLDVQVAKKTIKIE
jgi:hypothetical protein